MNVIRWSILAGVLLIGCRPTDPIDKLVDELSRSQREERGFPNGPWGDLPLPPTASIEQLVSGVYGTNFTILATRQVRIYGNEAVARLGDVNYTAVLVSRPGRKRILLLQFKQHSTRSGWFVRVYDTP